MESEFAAISACYKSPAILLEDELQEKCTLHALIS